MKKTTQNMGEAKEMKKSTKYIYAMVSSMVLVFTLCTPVYAETSGVDFSKLTETVFEVMKGLGMLVGAFGIIQFIKGFASDQPEAKIQAGMVIAGGLLLASAEAILTAMGFAS